MNMKIYITYLTIFEFVGFYKANIFMNETGGIPYVNNSNNYSIGYQ